MIVEATSKPFAYSSCDNHHALFIFPSPKNSLQHGEASLFTARRTKETNYEEGTLLNVIDSKSDYRHKGSGAVGRRRWIRDMIVFGSSSIPARTCALTTNLSSSDTTRAAAICDPTIESYQKGSNKIHIVGTAHVSSVSAQLAGAAVKEIKPAAVFIELDPQRINRAFRNGRITQPVNIVFFTESKGYVTMRMAKLFPQDFEKNKSKGLFRVFEKMKVQNPIQDMYEGLEAQGITPGEEFITAVEEGIRNNSIIILGDRPMDVTLKRIAKALFFDTDLKRLVEADKIITNKMKDRIPELQEWERQMNENGQQQQKNKELSPEQFSMFVERLKTKETTMVLMNEVKKAAPALYEALVGERDVFMGRAMDTTASELLPTSSTSSSSSLSSLVSSEMVGVVGLGHVEGIGRELISMGWAKFTPAECRM